MTFGLGSNHIRLQHFYMNMHVKCCSLMRSSPKPDVAIQSVSINDQMIQSNFVLPYIDILFVFCSLVTVININIIECYREMNFSTMIRWFVALLNSISNQPVRFTYRCCPRPKCRQTPDTTSDIGRVISILHF